MLSINSGRNYSVKKTYSDFMDEISSDELYEGMLAYGFFAEKLPPVFTSVPFFEYCNSRTTPFESGLNDYISQLFALRHRLVTCSKREVAYIKLCSFGIGCIRRNNRSVDRNVYFQT